MSSVCLVFAVFYQLGRLILDGELYTQVIPLSYARD